MTIVSSSERCLSRNVVVVFSVVQRVEGEAVAVLRGRVSVPETAVILETFSNAQFCLLRFNLMNRVSIFLAQEAAGVNPKDLS